MKVLLLADASVVHTLKWARSLSERGIEVVIFGMVDFDRSIYDGYNNIEIVIYKRETELLRSGAGNVRKLAYLKALPVIRRLIREHKPDIVHAHFATSYGLLGALAGFRPFIVSVWGMDAFDFPKISIVHRLVFKFILSRADRVLSTSNVMARETQQYTGKTVITTPFGIDLKRFRPAPAKSLFGKKDLVIGTIKDLEEKYGIEYLIRSFAILKGHHPKHPLKLLIVGGGSQDAFLKKLCADLGITSHVAFTGMIPYDEVVRYHNMIDIYVAVSVYQSESFGVAIIESSACEKPVVVSNMGGLPEVVDDGVTGFVVPARDPDATAAAIERLVLDKKLRAKMGTAGRRRVMELYDWKVNVDQMVSIYDDVLREKKKSYN